MLINGSEIVRSFGIEQIQFADRPRSDDLGDIARNDFARLRFAGLIANRYSPPRLDQFCNVCLGGVIRQLTRVRFAGSPAGPWT